MKMISAAVMLLALVACAPPSVLPGEETLGLAPATATNVQGAPVLVSLFPAYEARSVANAADWRELNRAQAPEGALE